MKVKNILFILALFLLTADISFAQVDKKAVSTPAAGKSDAVRTSPAYAEVLLQKTELTSELESLLVEYTEEYPKVKELRFQSGRLQTQLDRLLAVNAADASKLSVALGKLMVRKSELDTDLWGLQKEFNDQHPDVKRAKRKAEIFEAAIVDILQSK